MTAAANLAGVCPARFEPVRQAFAANFAEGLELGAGVCVTIEGEVVLDLQAGWADRARTRPFEARTLVPVFSSTKAITGLMLARLVSQGRLDYARPVAEVWPEFAQGGKAAITVEQCLSHQDGLAAVPGPFDPELWFDWAGITARIAAMAPLWPPGTASGYHPSTFGFIAGEIFRRVDGRTIGTALSEDLARPLDLDLFIGLPESEDGRVADMQRPPGAPDFGELTPLRREAFLQPWSAPPGRDGSRWRRAEIPSANGHATAQALARLYAAVACDGHVGWDEILAPGVAAEMSQARITGPDLVLPFTVSWGAGVLRNDPIGAYGPGLDTVGHSGWGGSCVFADPEQRLSFAYVMTKQSVHLVADPRPGRIIRALYESL